MLTSWYLLEPGIILDFVLASVVLLCKKKPHIKLLFVFTKVLSKTEIHKLVVGNCGRSIFY